MTRTTLYRRVAMATGAALLASATVVSAAAVSTTAGASTPTALTGTFKITAGASLPAGGTPTGSYFRMLVPGGTLNGADTNYFTNPSSSASDQTYTLLSPGTAGGLKTGSFQAAPSPAFDGSGNALANSIIQPTGFAGLNFSIETQTPDAQTGTAVVAPSVTTDSSGNLSGNVQALSASWNNLYFNQGSPKPDGTFPPPTAGPTGSYNPATGAYSLTWTSLIVGGPFAGFTGQWYLTGTFVPSSFQITTLALPGATKGTAYSTTLTAAGGPTPYKWKATGLPKGLKIGATTGQITGTVTSKKVLPGNFTVTVSAKDTAKPKVTATATYTLTLS